MQGEGERSIRLSDVAEVTDGDSPPLSYVRFYSRAGGSHAAVTLAVAKRKGANAIAVAHQLEAKLATVRPVLLPGNLNVTLTRNYGETAAEKSNELLYHMFLAVLSVSLLIALALGLREAVVVLVAIPVTLALTLFAFSVYGYTLNRITLFALIFSIGILVDDAIVVVENIVRHVRMGGDGGSSLVATAVRAVDEVGNPTILATLTVVAAILPMAFVGGLMGPYMRPIPMGASAAMLFSLAAAFIVTPWAAVRLLRAESAHGPVSEGAATRLYRRAMASLTGNGRVRLAFLAGVSFLLLASAALVPLKLVTVKMLPFDNKSEFQVIVDMPEGTALEQTARVSAELAHEVLKDPGVPLTIMAAIPFSLVGILPAHAAMGAFFTATSMIGFIAGAGIVVRNSIILVDFIEMRLREGMPLAEAVVDAGAVRFRPMALTAAAVIVGSAVILFDPIFQGLAISLMAGEVASLLLSRVTVPVLYFMSHRNRQTTITSVVPSPAGALS